MTARMASELTTGRLALRTDLSDRATWDPLRSARADTLRIVQAKIWNCLKIPNAPVNWISCGDSTAEGARTASIFQRWPWLVTQRIRAAIGQTSGGLGWIPASYGTGDMLLGFADGYGLQVAVPLAWSTTGGAASASVNARSNYGLGGRCVSMAGATADALTLTIDQTGVFKATSVDVCWGKAATSAVTGTIYLDGTSVQTFNPVVPLGSQVDNAFYRVAIPQDGATHTVKVQASGTGNIYLSGFKHWNGDEANGFRYWDAAASGTNSSYHAADKNSVAQTWQWDRWADINPDVVSVLIGINNFYNSTAQTTTPEQMRADLVKIIANARAASTASDGPAIILMPTYERGAVPATLAQGPTWRKWAEYRQTMYDVAAADPKVLVFDLAKRFPAGVQPTDMSHGGIVYSDGTHITTKGAPVVGQPFADHLLAG